MQPFNGSWGIISGNLKMSYPRLMEMASLSPNITRAFVPIPAFSSQKILNLITSILELKKTNNVISLKLPLIGSG